MAYTFKKTEKMVVTFLTIGFIGTLILLSLFLSQRSMFRIGQTYFSDFKSAKGISKSTIITLHNIPVGVVKEIILTEDNTIRVRLTIYSRYVNRVRENSVLVLRNQIIGTTELVLYPGSDDSPLVQEDATVLSSDTEEGVRYRSAYERNISSSANIDNALLNANMIMSTLNDPYIGVSPTLKEVNSILIELNKSMTKGTLGYLLNDDNVINMATNSFEIFEKSLSNIYYLSEDVKELSSLLRKNKNNFETIIDNTVIITDDLIITTKEINKMMPDMKILISNAALISSNMSPLAEDIKNINKRFR